MCAARCPGVVLVGRGCVSGAGLAVTRLGATLSPSEWCVGLGSVQHRHRGYTPALWGMEDSECSDIVYIMTSSMYAGH